MLKIKDKVPPNFNTHLKTRSGFSSSNGYTLKREFAVALNDFRIGGN
jgi:hypothetical protein